MASAERHLETCRLCWRPIDWSAEHLEYEEMHVYYRCPHCGSAFPVRHSDVATMEAPKGETSGAAPV